MSAPTKQFHRLSIGRNTPSTQAQGRAARASENPGPSDDDDSSHGSDGDDSSQSEHASNNSGADDDESHNASSVQARSGITYGLEQLDSETEAGAIVGLMGQFDVADCRTTSSGYAFQLSTRPQVRLGRDSYTCTCSSSLGRPGLACQHIFVGFPWSKFRIMQPTRLEQTLTVPV